MRAQSSPSHCSPLLWHLRITKITTCFERVEVLQLTIDGKSSNSFKKKETTNSFPKNFEPTTNNQQPTTNHQLTTTTDPPPKNIRIHTFAHIICTTITQLTSFILTRAGAAWYRSSIGAFLGGHLHLFRPSEGPWAPTPNPGGPRRSEK